MDHRFRFLTEVTRSLNGHVWIENAVIEGQREPVPLLVEAQCSRLSYPREEIAQETYDPLERESALYRILAAVEPDREGIKKFADTYGLIYQHQFKATAVVDGKEILTHGTPLSTWQRTIALLRHWVTVWDLIQKQDSRGLLAHVKSLPTDPRVHGFETAEAIADAFPASLGILDATAADRIKVAKRCLRFGIWESEVRENVSLHLMYDEVRDTFGIRLRMEDLAVAVWAQFVAAVVNSAEYASCRVCNKPFELTPDVARTNREFCSVPCRLKAYRARKREAVRLHERGKSFKQIADQLGSTVKTVRGWIKEAEG